MSRQQRRGPVLQRQARGGWRPWVALERRLQQGRAGGPWGGGPRLGWPRRLRSACPRSPQDRTPRPRPARSLAH
eukprot:1706283-Rhodomonas_salina.1